MATLVRVAVVDDNDVWRPNLVAALVSRGFEVAAASPDGEELLTALAELGRSPLDVAIVDLRLPPTWSDEGIVLAKELRRRYGQLGIILSGYEQDVQLHYATRAMNDLGGEGGIGYLFKDRTSRNSLEAAIDRVAACRTVVNQSFSREAAEEYRTQRAGNEDFSERELEVLDLLVRGLTNREIADLMHLSIPVIERNLTKIFRVLVPTGSDEEPAGTARRENRRVLTVLEWLRRTGRLD